VSFILNIDTAVVTASVCLAEGSIPVQELINPEQRDSAAWLHTAIEQVMSASGITFQQLDAIAVSAGPGSYTGLRVGLSAAKGLCYALKKPLLLINTLQMMSVAATGEKADLFCPMIDARRKEIFTALYDQNSREIMPPTNLIVENNPFSELLSEKVMLFFGNGAPKLQSTLEHTNARFKTIEASAKHLSGLSYSALKKSNFANLAYAEPFYGKAFYTPTAKKEA
jgi:tRNA threonylcarbamoyladenosine biosynthesis protein TsaB